MTGIGIGEIEAGSYTCNIELKSVNNRYLEISCRLPSIISMFEQILRDRLRRELDRGKIYAQVSVKQNTDAELDLKVNCTTVRQIKKLLDIVSQEAGLDEQVTLNQILKFTEIFDTQNAEKNNPELANLFHKTLDLAIANMKSMRNKEGNALVEDINERIVILERDRKTILSLVDDHVKAAQNKFNLRIESLCTDAQIDPDRIQVEIAIMADKLDVTEECVRLASHHKLFMEILQIDGPVGKKMNFLLQEMNREVNTISSKAANVDIQHLAVSMKNEIEKIREQVQNLV